MREDQSIPLDEEAEKAVSSSLRGNFAFPYIFCVDQLLEVICRNPIQPFDESEDP